ncbi:MAG: hemerythrin domain-containing protein [Chloroflexota bacterium]
MAGELEIIDQVIAQHQIIRLSLQGVQSSLTDFDALFSMQKAQSGWAQSSVDKLQDQKQQFQDALSRVQKGLSDHFSWEERVLPPLLGEALTKALIFVHSEIRQQLEKTVTLVNDSTLKGPNQKDRLTEKLGVQNGTVTLTQMIEEHATTEEQILGMLKKAYQAQAESTKSGRTPR